MVWEFFLSGESKQGSCMVRYKLASIYALRTTEKTFASIISTFDAMIRVFLTADGAYNSERLEELAAQKNIDIQTTSLTGAEPHDIGKIKKYLSSVSLSVSECHVFFARQLFPLAAEQNGCCKTYMAAV